MEKRAGQAYIIVGLLLVYWRILRILQLAQFFRKGCCEGLLLRIEGLYFQITKLIYVKVKCLLYNDEFITRLWRHTNPNIQTLRIYYTFE